MNRTIARSVPARVPDQPVVGLAGDLVSFACCGFCIGKPAFIFIKDRHHAENPALADAITDLAPYGERFQVHGLCLVDAALECDRETTGIGFVDEGIFCDDGNFAVHGGGNA